MRKFLKIFSVLFVATLLAFPAVGTAAMKDMWAKVYTWDGKMNVDGTPVLTEQTSNITFVVFPKDMDQTRETLYVYNDDAFTSLTNPVTGTNYASDTVCKDMIRFRVDPTETSDTAVDLIVVDQDGGYTAFIEDFDEYTHSIIIDERKGIKHHGAVWYYYTTSGELDTGIDFNQYAVIHDVAVEALITDADETLDVGLLSSGTNGDADGLIDGISIATDGYLSVRKHSNAAGGFSSGASHYHYVDNPLGALLGTTIVGSGGDTLVGYHGYIVEWDHWFHATQEQSLTWTISSCSTAWGLIHYYFSDVR